MSTAPTPPMVCKVCRRSLSRIVNGKTGEVTWEHWDQDSLSGHKPVAVETDTGKLQGRCDFCNSDLIDELWILPVSDFLAGQRPTDGRMQGFEGDWGACGSCAPLIDGNQWTALLRRVQKVWEANHGLPAPQDKKTGWALLYRLVRRNIKGSIHKVD